MQLVDIRDLLLTITSKVHHYEAAGETGNYIVWAEDGQGDSFFSNNKMQLQAIRGTIDYFTKIEFDPNFDLIQNKLNSVKLSWRLNSIQHEEETGYIHYEWEWEAGNSIG